MSRKAKNVWYVNYIQYSVKEMVYKKEIFNGSGTLFGNIKKNLYEINQVIRKKKKP